MREVISQLQQTNKLRTSETYHATLKSFMQFRENEDVLLKDLNSDMMLMYEAYLRQRGLTKNSISFYIRILRAVYNRAVEKGLTSNRNPFKHVYTGIDKTVKRAIPLKTIKQIKNLNLSFKAMILRDPTYGRSGGTSFMNEAAGNMLYDTIIVNVKGGGTFEDGTASKTISGVSHTKFDTYTFIITNATPDTQIEFTSPTNKDKNTTWFIDDICVKK